MDPQKIEGVLGWPTPSFIKVLRRFLGLTGYYSKFIQGYGKIVAPLTALLKKNARGWNEEADQAFRVLKLAMTQAPVLALPKFSQLFIIERDASGTGLGVVLMQMGRPIAYLSHALHGQNLSLCTYDKELLPIVIAIQKWSPYLLGRSFIIRTN